MANGLLDIISKNLYSEVHYEATEPKYSYKWLKICDSSNYNSEDIYKKTKIHIEIFPSIINWKKESVIDMYSQILESIIKIQKFYKKRFLKKVFPFSSYLS